MLQNIRQLNHQHKLWEKDDRLLLAISGGVDSMVLLKLMEKLPVAERPSFGVAHVDHQLRPESKQEAKYLENYCQTRGIPFHLHCWEDSKREKGNIEARGRDVRYTFFAEVCQAHHYRGVVTAHHSDDQGETFLLKLLRGTQLKDLVSMGLESHQGALTIYRPLLTTTKQAILEFAYSEKINYFEDETNQSLAYQRNRVRHQVIPLLKGENDNFLQHIHNLVKQIEYANDIIGEATKPLIEQMIKKVNQDEWQIDLTQFTEVSESYQYMILVAFFQEVLIERKVPLQESHLRDVLVLFNSNKAYACLTLPHNWEVRKNYQLANLSQKQSSKIQTDALSGSFQLEVGQGVFVSETEWFGLEEIGKELILPSQALHWEREELLLKEAVSEFPLTIQRGNLKERIVINATGQRKEVRRILIDEKIPRNLREKIWLVANQRDLLWIVPIRKSYLSIRKETDKIHYRLIYLKAKLDLGGDFYVRKRY